MAIASVQAFEAQRGRLRGLAYRMLGSVADADDVLQDAYLRWHTAVDGIREPAAWLTTTVTRLCIDRLRGAKAERETYVGPWLPEPWLGDETGGERPDGRQDRADDLSVAFLLLLERLSAEERAALLLHDVFELGYPAVADALGKSEAACRQMVHRARERVQAERTRFAVPDGERRALLERFIEASRSGEESKVLALLAPDASLTADGGGKAWAARRIVQSAARIARLLATVARKRPTLPVDRIADVNGALAVVSWLDGKPVAVTSVDIVDGRIAALYRVMNPDKLRGVPDAPPAI